MDRKHYIRRTKPPRVKRLAKGYAFVSYSSKDWSFVQSLIGELKTEDIWVDKWNLDLGEALPERIESGISGASEFILILSRSSLESRWVKYESHMAVIRMLEDANFRIVVVKVDDCEVPLRFRPFLYADLTRDPNTLKNIKDRLSPKAGSARVLHRRHFINRSAELGNVEAHVSDLEKSIICLYGFYGIGKRTLAEEAIRRFWQAPSRVILTLTPAHAGARLCLELCALAGMPFPADGTPSPELRKQSLLAAERIVEKGQVLLIDRFDAMLDEDGSPHADINAVVGHLSSLPPSKRVPIFILTRRMPHWDRATSLRIGLVKVGELSVDYMVTLLDNEVRRIDHTKSLGREAIAQLARQLYGYPLAGRLAAPMLVKYTPEYLLQNLSHITSLRRDIAEAILTDSSFSEDQTAILRMLALSAGPLSVQDITKISGRSPDEVVRNIDQLAEHNVLEPNGASIELHPLISDYYWKQARSAPDFTASAQAVADRAVQRLNVAVPASLDYITWLAMGCRLFFLLGKPEQARNLRSDLRGELKIAAIELYQKQDYELSLKYCDEFLADEPSDFDVLFHKARNLSRLGRAHDAFAVIDKIGTLPLSPVRHARLEVARARTHLESKERKLDLAKEYFLKALELDGDFLPALQGVAEVLLRMDAVEEAAGFIDRAIRVSPMDSFALSLKAEILWRKGDRRKAIEIMITVVKTQPQNAAFLFRIGRFLHQSGMSAEAYKYFRKARKSNQSYLDIGLSLASVALDLGKLDEAWQEIEALRGKGSHQKRAILNGIEAQYWLLKGDIDKAATLANQCLDDRWNTITLGIMAKVEAAQAQRAQAGGLELVADDHKGRALNLLKEGLSLDPNNGPLQHQLDMLESGSLPVTPIIPVDSEPHEDTEDSLD